MPRSAALAPGSRHPDSALQLFVRFFCRCGRDQVRESSGLVNDTLERRPWSEIDDQPDREPRSLEIVQHLRLVSPLDLRPRFHFDDDQAVHDDVGAKRGDDSAAECDGQACFLNYVQPRIRQRNREYARTDELTEAVSKFIVDIEEDTEHSVGQLVVQEPGRSEERRVGKECRSRWWPYQ